MVAEQHAESPALSIPDVSGLDALGAALAYAAAGFYVLPTDPANIKHPGSVVGTSWPTRSSRSAAHIHAWWDAAVGGNPDYGIALHLGRSNVVALDVDKPENLPAWLEKELLDSRSALQTTRVAPLLIQEPDALSMPTRHPKGHRLFSMPPGVVIGNSVKDLQNGHGPWGEVRGHNGVIIVAPTKHPADDGLYTWVRTGPLKELPPSIAGVLATAPENRALPASEAVAALAEFPEGAPTPAVTRALGEALSLLADAALAGSGRHDAMNRGQQRLARLGEQGHEGVLGALATLRAMAERVLGAGRMDEWNRGLRGAVAAVEARPTPSPSSASAYADFIGPTARAAWDPEKIGAPRTVPFGGEGGGEAAPRAPSLPTPDDDALFEQQVQREYWNLRAREEARRRLRADAITAEPIMVESLAELLARPKIEVAYRVTDLWPTGGRVMVAAQAKAGKTHLVANLVKNLVDGGDFLGKFACAPLAGRVAILDNEMSEHQLQHWYGSLGIRNTAAIDLHYLKGKLSQFNILDDKIRAALAAKLRDQGIDVLVFDCVRPVLDALGLDEHKDAGVFLVAFDALLKEAGVGEAVVVHHMGHTGERSRGDSRLVDWPDATWKIMLGDPEDKASDRYFSAYGRDVDVSEDQIWFDSVTHTVQLAGAGSRREAAKTVDLESFKIDIIKYMSLLKGSVSKNNIEQNVTGKATTKRLAIQSLIDEGRLIMTPKGQWILK